MRMARNLAGALIALSLSGTAAAVPCFDASGIPLGTAPAPEIDCSTDRAISWRPGENEVLARDAAGNPMFKAYKAPAKKKGGNGPKAIADMTGRLVTPAQFDTVYVITPTLGVGERQIEAKDQETGFKLTRAFLIDLTTGQIRPTPYRTIFYSKKAPGVTGAAYLLGVLELDDSMRPAKAAILSPGGTETGLVVEADWHPILTNRHGLLSVDNQLFTASGEPPAGGRPLYDTIFKGLFAEIGTAPAGISAAPLPLYAPLNNVGQVQTLPGGFLGYVRGGSGDLWEVRSENGALRYYSYWGDGPPLVTSVPVGKAYTGIYISENSDVVETAEGWMHEEFREIFPTAELASADADAKLRAFIAAMRADLAEDERAKQQAALDAQAERVARAEAERETILARIDQAAKESWQGFALQDLKRDVIRFQLEGRYEAAGLYVDPEMRREICWSRQSVICDYSAPSASSGSGYVSTWEKAFENATTLNNRQYQERCARAFNGYGALCTTD